MSTLVASAHPSVAGARAARLRESGRLGGALPGGGDPKKGWGNGDASGAQKIHLCAPDASSDVRSLIRKTLSVGDHGRSPLLPMLRDGRSQQIAFAPDAPHQEITADRLCSRCSRISVLMEMREQICSRSILLCAETRSRRCAEARSRAASRSRHTHRGDCALSGEHMTSTAPAPRSHCDALTSRGALTPRRARTAPHSRYMLRLHDSRAVA